MKRTPVTAFHYPAAEHQRRHGPAGYNAYRSYKEWLRDEFEFRCVFCLVRELWLHEGASGFGVEHFEPKSKRPDWKCEYDNLTYCCNQCNRWKSTKQGFPNPCEVAMADHLYVDRDATVIHITDIGQRLIRYLRLNEEPLLGFRKRMLKTLGDETNAAEYLRFPTDLPNLKSLKPPSNFRTIGVEDCYYERRVRGDLPATY